VTERLNVTTKHYSAYKIKYYSYHKSDSSSCMQELTRAILTAVKMCEIAISGCLNFASDGITIVRKVRKHSSTDTTSCPRDESSATQLRGPQI